MVEVPPPMSFLMVDGSGDPNGSEEYRQAVEWLFSLSYVIKFRAKKPGTDYGVLPLEGLWWVEGLAAQVMHSGPFADEPSTIERLHSFIRSGGHKLRGGHHEIYLRDFNRTAPENLRTILRQPVTHQ